MNLDIHYFFNLLLTTKLLNDFLIYTILFHFLLYVLISLSKMFFTKDMLYQSVILWYTFQWSYCDIYFVFYFKALKTGSKVCFQNKWHSNPTALIILLLPIAMCIIPLNID